MEHPDRCQTRRRRPVFVGAVYDEGVDGGGTSDGGGSGHERRRTRRRFRNRRSEFHAAARRAPSSPFQDRSSSGSEVCDRHDRLPAVIGELDPGEEAFIGGEGRGTVEPFLVRVYAAHNGGGCGWCLLARVAGVAWCRRAVLGSCRGCYVVGVVVDVRSGRTVLRCGLRPEALGCDSHTIILKPFNSNIQYTF